MKNLFDKIVDVSEYLEALREGVPPCVPPKFLFQTVGGYGYYEGKLRAILDYDDLKPEVQYVLHVMLACLFCVPVGPSQSLLCKENLSIPAFIIIILVRCTVFSMLLIGFSGVPKLP